MDVALIPSVEFFRSPGHRIVSNACVACRGPVLSVKVQFRVPPQQVRRLALDEGSRTSAALSQILLAEMCGVRPTLESLPIGCGPETSTADAVLLIGDRAITHTQQSDTEVKICEEWDLGEKWCEWTGLPFVFAMWIAREDSTSAELTEILNAARDRGVAHISEIAAHESRLLDIPVGARRILSPRKPPLRTRPARTSRPTPLLRLVRKTQPSTPRPRTRTHKIRSQNTVNNFRTLIIFIFFLFACAFA